MLRLLRCEVVLVFQDASDMHLKWFLVDPEVDFACYNDQVPRSSFTSVAAVGDCALVLSGSDDRAADNLGRFLLEPPELPALCPGQHASSNCLANERATNDWAVYKLRVSHPWSSRGVQLRTHENDLSQKVKLPHLQWLPTM